MKTIEQKTREFLDNKHFDSESGPVVLARHVLQFAKDLDKEFTLVPNEPSDEDKVYELVYIGYEDMYFTIGLFHSLEEVESIIETANHEGSSLSEIMEYKFGLSDSPREMIKNIEREEAYSEEKGEYFWRTAMLSHSKEQDKL